MFVEAPVPELQEAIRHMHGCESSFVEAVPVTELFEGRPAWQGVVNVFDLLGHPTASRAYAWSYMSDEGRRRFVAVLHAGPVTSPQTAVTAAIVASIKKTEN
jgi:hypothetical protein